MAGSVNNPQPSETLLVNRAQTLDRAAQKFSGATGAAFRDVLSPEAELGRLGRNISANAASAFNVPFSGNGSSLVDSALGRSRATNQLTDAGSRVVRNSELTKRLRFTEQRFNNLRTAQGAQGQLAGQDLNLEFAKQGKKNQIDAARSQAYGTAVGSGLAAAANVPPKAPPIKDVSGDFLSTSNLQPGSFSLPVRDGS